MFSVLTGRMLSGNPLPVATISSFHSHNGSLSTLLAFRYPKKSQICLLIFLKIHQLEKGAWLFGSQKHLLILNLKVYFIFFSEIISNLRKCYKNYTKYSCILHADSSSVLSATFASSLSLILYLYACVCVYKKIFQNHLRVSHRYCTSLPL